METNEQKLQEILTEQRKEYQAYLEILHDTVTKNTKDLKKKLGIS